MIKASNVDDYIAQSEWKKEVSMLRALILECGLEESVKWGAPCYTIKRKNVVGLASFKTYVGLWFHNGVFLKDAAKHLIQASEKTKGLRQWRFQHLNEINADEVRNYIQVAILNQSLGKEIKAATRSLAIPEELAQCFENNQAVQTAFEGLTKGKQKEYAEYISNAKRHETKVSRIDKIIPMILSGIGLNDQYR